MKLISIIIPLYNNEKFISRCLDSIINQTYKKIEIIIINDGSTDESLNVIMDYQEKDDRIKVINKKNEGVSIARNIGIENSIGDYITFVDADDWLELDAIEKLYKEITEKNVDVVRGNYYINKSTTENTNIAKMYELSNKTIRKEEFKEYKMLEYFLLVEKPIANLVMLLLIKREVIEKNNIRFDTNLYMMEDVYFYLELFLNIDSIYYMETPIYHYYYNLDSATKSVKRYAKNIEGVIDVNEKIKKILVENDMFSNENISKLNANHLKIITNYFYFMMRDKIEENKELIEKYISSEKFREIIKDINMKNIPLKNKIMINLIKYNKITFLFIFNTIISYVAKVLKK